MRKNVKYCTVPLNLKCFLPVLKFLIFSCPRSAVYNNWATLNDLPSRKMYSILFLGKSGFESRPVQNGNAPQRSLLSVVKRKDKKYLITGSYFLHSRNGCKFLTMQLLSSISTHFITIFSVTVLLWQLLTFNAYCCKQQCTLYCLTLCSFRAIFLLKILCFICVLTLPTSVF
jgi:hypothetical protein